MHNKETLSSSHLCYVVINWQQFWFSLSATPQLGQISVETLMADASETNLTHYTTHRGKYCYRRIDGCVGWRCAKWRATGSSQCKTMQGCWQLMPRQSLTRCETLILSHHMISLHLLATSKKSISVFFFRTNSHSLSADIGAKVKSPFFKPSTEWLAILNEEMQLQR